MTVESFRTLAASLRASGFDSQARRLEAAVDSTYTTSTETLAALGVEVLAVRRQCSGLSGAQKQLCRDCLRLVHHAWPGFGGLRGFWYRWF